MKNTKLFLFLLLPFFLFSQEKEKRLALVIGNANYDKGELKNPVNDARLIASTLDSLDFDVILKENLSTKRDMTAAIREFGSRRSEYDVAFVYYAGHGVQVDDENFLLPTKETFEEEFDVIDYGVSVQNIMRYLRAQTNQVNILILDACRDNPFESSWGNTRSLKGQGLAKIPPPTGSLIAFSTDSGQTAPDGDGENSIYSTSLSKNMLLEDTSIDQVFRNVRAEVLGETGGAQRPVESTQLTGQTFYLVKSDYSKEINKIIELTNGNYLDDALEISTILINNEPSDRAFLLRAKVYAKLNNFQKAINDCLSSLKKNPNNLEAMFYIGKMYYYSAEFTESIKYLSNIIDINPDYSADVFKFRAQAYTKYENKIQNQPLLDWTVFYENYPKSSLANFMYAYWSDLQINEKIKFYKKGIDIEIQSNIKNKIGYYKKVSLISAISSELAEEYMKLNDKINSIATLDLAIELNSNDHQSYLNKFDFLIRYEIDENDNWKMNDLLKIIKNISVNNSDAAYKLAQFYRDNGKYDQALEFIDRAITMEPNSSDFMSTKGDILLNSSKFEEALNLFKSLYEKFPNDPIVSANLSNSYYFLARDLINDEKYGNAVLFLEKAMDITINLITHLKKNNLIPSHPHNATQYLRLYNIYNELYGIYYNFDMTSFHDEINYDAKKNIYTKEKKGDILIEAIENYPNEYSAIYNKMFDHFGDISYLEKAIEINPKNERTHFALFFEYIKLGDFENAQRSIDNVIKFKRFSGGGYYNYKIGLYLYQKKYNDCLDLIDEIEEFYNKNGYVAPTTYSKSWKKYFRESLNAYFSHLKSYLYFNTGKLFESVVEISKSIEIVENIYFTDPSFAIYYRDPHNYVPYDELNSAGLVNSIEELKFDNEEVFLLENKTEWKLGEIFDNGDFYKLFLIRGNIFAKLGLQNYADKDYESSIILQNKLQE